VEEGGAVEPEMHRERLVTTLRGDDARYAGRGRRRYFDTAVTGWAGGNVRGSLGVKVCALRMPSVRSQNNGREPKEVRFVLAG